MGVLSNYLSGGGSRSTGRPRRSGYYPSVTRYEPYSVPRRNTQGVNQASPFAGQDLNSALLAQQQNRKNTTPSSTFENNYDYDPLLARIEAISTASLANAKTEAEQLRRKAAVDTGDPEIAKSLNLDPNTISAASQNPESIMSV